MGHVEKGLDLLEQGRRLPEESRQQLDGGLDRSFGPPELLALEGVHVLGDLGRHDEIRQKYRMPTGKLDPIGKVHVLGQGIPLPSPAVDDGRPPPDTRRPVEVHVEAVPVPCRLLDHEMSVDADGLRTGEKGTPSVEMPPARLDQGKSIVAHEKGNASQEIVLGRDKVGVEHRQKLPPGCIETRGQSAGLESGPLASPDHPHIAALGPKRRRRPFDDFAGFVGGIVQHLDFVPPRRIAHPACGPDHPFGHVHLVVYGDLGRYHGQIIPRRRVSERFQNLSAGGLGPRTPPVE